MMNTNQRELVKRWFAQLDTGAIEDAMTREISELTATWGGFVRLAHRMSAPARQGAMPSIPSQPRVGLKRIIAVLMPQVTPRPGRRTRGGDADVMRFAIPGHEAWILYLQRLDDNRSYGLRIELTGADVDAVLPATLRLTKDGSPKAMVAQLDETGEATFRGLDTGSYALELELSDDESVHITSIPIGLDENPSGE